MILVRDQQLSTNGLFLGRGDRESRKIILNAITNTLDILKSSLRGIDEKIAISKMKRIN
jgi:hypothetical protein